MGKHRLLLGLFAVSLASAGQAQISFTNGAGLQYGQDFNSLSNSTSPSNVVPAGWALFETGSNADQNYIVGTGSASGGNTLSFGATGNTDRAFGEVTSGSLVSYIGAQFQNNTDSALVALQFNFFVEQWRKGDATLPDSAIFQYSYDATSLGTGTWTAFNGLNWKTVNAAAAVGALDGNLTANRANIVKTLGGISVPVGGKIYIRWQGINITDGDDGLSVDDFSVTAVKGLPPVVPATVSVPSDFQIVGENVGNASFNLNVSGANAQPIRVALVVAGISTAVPGTDFTWASDTITIPANTNGTVPVNLTVVDDANAEKAEFVAIRVLAVQNANMGGAGYHILYIKDNDYVAPVATREIKLNLLSSFNNGTAGVNSAEISAYDPASKRLFIANSVGAKMDIVDFSNPANMSLISSVSITPYGNINSVAVYNGIVACGVENAAPQSTGKVVFFDVNGTFVSQVDAGAMPDMVAFTHDGKKVVVANEGEPNAAYTNDPEGTISIVDISGGVASVTNANVTHINFQSFNGQEAALRAQGIRIFGPGATAAKDFEPEYVTIADNDSLAYVTLQENNAIAVIDIVNGTLVDLKPLGYKDHSLGNNALDASDQSGQVLMANFPIKGVYMPDAVSHFSTPGGRFLVTANEGDSRDYSGFTEVARLSNGAYVLDPATFPDAAILKNPKLLGRLNVTLATGDTDGDNDFDEIHAYGGRSFSIWNAETGTLVFDSGDLLEQITAADPVYGAIFNASNGLENPTFKNRSDDKGPEPEGVMAVEVGGHQYVFVALERIGGVMVFNVDNPAAPVFTEYINNRSTTGLAGDLGAEGLFFIPHTESPNGRSLVVVSNEVSSTVTVYEVNEVTTETYEWHHTDSIGTWSGITLYDGGASGLHYLPGTDREFMIVSDRGPNAIGDNNPNNTPGTPVKVFPLPGYAPRYHHIKAQNDSVLVLNTTELKRPGGTPATGLPNPTATGGTGEVAWSDTTGTVIAPDVWGLDSEGIAEGNDNDLWIAEEYGPTMWRVNKTSGEVINRYTPFGTNGENIGIDTLLRRRIANRGFEGVTFAPNGKVYAVVQAPLANPTVPASDSSRIHRLVEIDPFTNVTRTFAYVHDAPVGGPGGIRNQDWKLGDIVAVNNNEFLVLEHAQRGTANKKLVYKINLAGATPITTENFGGHTLEQLHDTAGLSANGIVPVAKSLLLDLLPNGWELGHDKPEGLTIINDSTIAVINDNDYGIDSPLGNGSLVTTGKTTKLYIFTLPQYLALNTCSPIAIEAQDATTFCSGDSVLLEETTAATGLTYQWVNGTQNINGATADAYTATAAGNYHLTANGADNCVRRSNRVEVTVSASPAATITSPGTTFCDGGTVVLSANTGTGLTYQWTKNGANIGGATGATYTANSTGQYRVIVTNATGCSTTAAPKLIEEADLPATPVIIPFGNSLTTASQSNYQWYRNGTAIAGATLQTYTPTQPGNYTVKVTNAFGCSATSAAYVVGPDLSIDETQGLSMAIYPNPTSETVYIRLTGNAAGMWNLSLTDAAGREVRQSRQQAGQQAENTLNLDVTGLAPGLYMLKVTQNGLALTRPVIVR